MYALYAWDAENNHRDYDMRENSGRDDPITRQY